MVRISRYKHGIQCIWTNSSLANSVSETGAFMAMQMTAFHYKYLFWGNYIDFWYKKKHENSCTRNSREDLHSKDKLGPDTHTPHTHTHSIMQPKIPQMTCTKTFDFCL